MILVKLKNYILKKLLGYYRTTNMLGFLLLKVIYIEKKRYPLIIL